MPAEPMSRGFQGAMLKALGANEHVITVTSAEPVVDGFQRVWFTAPTLFDDFDPGPGDYLRLWVPDPDDPEREVQRGYTVIHADPTAGTFALDFVLHEPLGPASGWAAAAGPGDSITATVYGSAPFTVPTPTPAGCLLVGDAASLPAINSMLAVIPAHVPVEVLLEWGDERERAIPVAEHPSVRVRWFRRDLGGGAVVEALAGRDWTDWYAVVSSERATVKAVKTALREVHGFPKSDVKATAYWIHGKSFGTSRGGSVKRAAKSSADAAATAQPAAPARDAAADTAAAAAVAVPASMPPATSSSPVTSSTPARWRSQAGAELLAPVGATLRLAALVQVVVTLAGLVPFVLLAEVGRRLLAGAPVDEQWDLARLALIVLGAATTASAVLMLWLHVVDARFAVEVRRRLLAKLARLPLGWFTERNSGIVKQAVSDDTASLHYYVTHAAVDVAGALTAPLAVLVYLFVVDARLAAALLVPVIVYLFVFAGMMQASRGKLGEVAAWTARMNGEAVAYLDGLPVVRTFGGPGASRFRRTVDECLTFLAGWQGPLVRRKAFAALLTDAMTFLAIIVVLGGALVGSGRMVPADLLPFLLLGTTFGGRLLALAYNAGGLREGKLAARRIGLTLTEDELATVRPDAGGAAGGVVAASGAAVELRAVTFGYRRGEPVVHDVSLHLAPGTVTALVGPSGSGKSTLAALVARFHDPDVGVVTVDGVDVRTLAPDDLYRRVGFVLQDVHLVRASLHDNIALAAPDVGRAAVVAAAEAAQLGALVARLPHGYDTVIGDTVQLSGGEAQRVAIARALVADTPVVVLDEATAFADPESERLVQRALTRLLAGRTVLMIAHRLHTVVDADAIVVLDEGRVVERGTHAELLAAGGRYHRMWQHHTTAVAR